MENGNIRRFCVSCGVDISARKDSVIFACPNCNSELPRCGRCRKRGETYVCKVCGFNGP